MEAKEMLDKAELEYDATAAGEEILRDEITKAHWPYKEVLENRLENALKLRAEMELEDGEEGTYTFPASKFGDAVNRIDKANRKLARAGIEERFTYTTEGFIEEDEDGNKFQMIKMDISHPKLNVAGWDFVAAVDKAPDGSLITRVLPGQELGGHKPDSQKCDHCDSNRRRKATYMLRDENGEYKQVGSTCLESFLGVQPKGLWALSYDLEETERIGRDRNYGGPDTVLSLEETVAYGLAVSDGGNKYVSAAYAQDTERNSTAQEVRNQFFSRTLKNEERVDPTPYIDQARQIIAETSFDDSSDYGSNMKTILSSEWVGAKQLGMAVSVIAAHNRTQNQAKWAAEKLAKASAPKSVGFLGKKSEKIGQFSASIKRVDTYPGSYGYNAKPTTRFIMEGPDGKLVKWSTSKDVDFREGDVVTFAHATVKDHDHFNGDDQTVIKLPKIIKHEAAKTSEDTAE